MSELHWGTGTKPEFDAYRRKLDDYYIGLLAECRDVGERLKILDRWESAKHQFAWEWKWLRKRNPTL